MSAKNPTKRAVPIRNVEYGTTGTIHHGKTHLHGVIGIVFRDDCNFSFHGDGLGTSNVFLTSDWVFEADIQPVILPTKVGAVVKITTSGAWYTLFRDGTWVNMRSPEHPTPPTGYVQREAERGDVEVLFAGLDD